jgi:hypothetical protein
MVQATGPRKDPINTNTTNNATGNVRTGTTSEPTGSTTGGTTEPGVAERSATTTTTRTPTTQTSSEARLRAANDPMAQQLRAQAFRVIDPGDGGGEPDLFPANGTVQQAKDFMSQNQPTSDDPTKWTKDQREAFNVLAQDFGDRHVEAHEAWHRANGPGGTNGPGSGEEFLQFHRDMMRQFEEETGVKPPSGWNPATPIPTEFQDPEGKRRTDNPNVQRPAWLTTDGTGTTNGNRDFGNTVTVDGQTFDSLDDFENPDQLGRALAASSNGNPSYHASAHSRMGGTMGGFESPRDPTFYAWHGHIDHVLDEWLATPNGQAWSQANPDSPLISDQGGAHHSH